MQWERKSTISASPGMQAVKATSRSLALERETPHNKKVKTDHSSRKGCEAKSAAGKGQQSWEQVTLLLPPKVAEKPAAREVFQMLFDDFAHAGGVTNTCRLHISC